MSPEGWLPITSWPGYEVSDHGRVRSMDHRTVTSRGARNYKGRVLSQTVLPLGYHAVSARVADGEKKFRVHVLVLEAFVGPRPAGMDGCHNDGNPANNNLSNLRWDTRAANMADMKRHGRDPRLNRTHCPRGHLLAHPNLDPSNLAKGKRACRSCRNGITVARRRAAGVDRQAAIQEAADRCYAKIAWPEESEAS
jgi:hypothetical protein